MLDGIKTLVLLPDVLKIRSEDIVTNNVNYLDFFAFKKDLNNIFGDKSKKLMELLIGGESLTINFENREIFLKNKEKPINQLDQFFNDITKNKFINNDNNLREWK
jgi:hypothetical protein